MLFSRANTQALVGATAIVEATNGRTLLPDKLWRFIWSEPVEQSYMHALFQSEDVRQELGKLSSGTSASMRNISQEKLYQLRLPVAPVEMQRVFRRRADTFQSVIALQSMALATAERTFRALLARSFSDEASVAPAVAAVEAAVA
jgi:type I restriction enzyme S subunit